VIRFELQMNVGVLTKRGLISKGLYAHWFEDVLRISESSQVYIQFCGLLILMLYDFLHVKSLQG
jgi:hypothetical protein